MDQRSKILIILLAAIIAGSILYMITPPDWIPNAIYSGVIKISYEGKEYIANFDFNISIDKTSNITIDRGRYIIVNINSPGKIAPGNPLVIKAELYDNGQPVVVRIKDIELSITTPDGHTYAYSPSRIEDHTVVFDIQPYIHARETAFIFGSAIVLFASASIVHYVITGLYATMALVLIGVQPAKTAYYYYMAPLIMVFIAGSAMELVIREKGLDERVARLLSRIARGPASLILGASFLASFLSMWMSNTAATYVMLPLVAALLTRAGLMEKRFSSIVMVSLAMGASIGGTATLIGTPPNLIAAEFLNKFVYKTEFVSFVKWLEIGLPAWAIGYSIGVILAILYARLVARNELKLVTEKLKELRTQVEHRPWSKDEILGLIGILFLIVLWLTEPLHHISTGVAAGIGILFFFATGLLKPKEHWKKLAWDLMVLFGAGLTLGSALMKSGWAGFLLSQLRGVEALGWAAFLVVGFAAYIIGTFISSHTSASAFVAPLTIPLGMIIAPSIGISPETGATLATVVAIVSLNNAIALPISTPPSAIVYASGKAKIKDLMTYGFLFGILANLAIILLLISYWVSVLH